MTPIATSSCACPTSSPYQLLALINNNFVNLFYLMSAGKWTGKFVNLGACLCSEPEILKALNNNLVSFFNWVSANGLGGVQAGSADLALNDVNKAVLFPTAFAAAPIVKCWIVPPDNTQPIVEAEPNGSTISTTGFTALFGAAIPAAGFKLMWIASKAS